LGILWYSWPEEEEWVIVAKRQISNFLLPIRSFSFGHCIVCHSNYDLWLPFDIFKPFWPDNKHRYIKLTL
jgi:hypothetical protein